MKSARWRLHKARRKNESHRSAAPQRRAKRRPIYLYSGLESYKQRVGSVPGWEKSARGGVAGAARLRKFIIRIIMTRLMQKAYGKLSGRAAKRNNNSSNNSDNSAADPNSYRAAPASPGAGLRCSAARARRLLCIQQINKESRRKAKTRAGGHAGFMRAHARDRRPLPAA